MVFWIVIGFVFLIWAVSGEDRNSAAILKELQRMNRGGGGGGGYTPPNYSQSADDAMTSELSSRRRK